MHIRICLLTLALCAAARAQLPVPKSIIKSFSVGADQTLTWPNAPGSGKYLVDLPDEHTTFFPPAIAGGPYLVFASSKVSGTTGGAAVLQTTDLKNFSFATGLGYSMQVMAPPVDFTQCNPAYQTEFDENYAAPGSVVQDPTLPAGNLIMIYESENHCPGGVNQQPFYATVGFTRSSDNGKTWPAPENGPLGGPNRFPVLQTSDPQPSSPHPAEGDAIPSAFVDKNASGDYYLFVAYTSHPAPPAKSDGFIRVARAKLGTSPLGFLKWYNGSFSQPGIGGSDTGVMPSAGCGNGNGRQQMPEISYNDDLGLYLLLFVCVSGPSGSQTAAWYYSTATSLDIQDWTAPQMISGSLFPVSGPCSADGQSGQQFDGWYPSTISSGAVSGHTKLTGTIFFQNGCDTGARIFSARSFTISAGSPPAPSITSVSNGATYAAGGLVPGSWAQAKGSNVASVARIWTAYDFTGLGNALPTSLSGVQVMVNNIPASIYYVAPGQVNFQVPSGVSGTASVQVLNYGVASNAFSAAAVASAPGVFPNVVNGVNYAIAVFTNGQLAGDPSVNSHYRIAQPGDAIQLYATGLTAEPTGVLPVPQGIGGVSVTVGNVTIPADYAGQTPYVGEFQINFTIPQEFANMPAGNYPISIEVNGVSSPTTINTNPPGSLVLPIQP
jgi:uncharacterized protein (TIGR03437 family)